jgi:hypothetical protein
MKKLLLALPLAALGLWLLWQFGAGMNSSHACLTIAAQRLLAGGTFTGDFNEPNPPMSFMLYVPHVLMSRYLGVPAQYAPYVFGLICLIASVLAVREILKHWPRPDADGKTVFLYAYIVAATLMTSSVYFYFGERDHIVMLGLYPFLLAQLSITWRYDVPKKLTWAVLALGAAAIMIKPQFGLLPAMVLAHRAVAQKRFLSLMRDPDFVALAAVVILYAAAIALLFPDYVTDGLPEFMMFYATAHNAQTPLIWFLYTMILGCVAVFGSVWGVPLPKMRLALLCHLGAFISLLLFLIQMKGIYYHLLPAFGFLLTGLALQAYEIARHYLGKKWIAVPLVIALVFIAAGALRPERTTALRHADYARTQLAQLVKDCAPHCAYMIFDENIEKTLQIQIYTGATYASRFPVLWWLPGLVAGLDATPADPKLNRIREKYSRFIAEDIARYRPEVMAFIASATIEDHRNFDLFGFLSASPAFSAELVNYERAPDLHDNRKNYFRLPSPEDDLKLDYVVYRRRK